MEPTVNKHIPDDILFTLISKLPVKSLLRFTSACKSWNDMIQSPYFVAEHNHHQKHNNNSNKVDSSHLLYIPDHDQRNPSQICTMFCRSDVPPATYVKESNMLLPLRGSCEVVGACEGLICLTKDSNVYIWNPFTGSLKIVPPSGQPSEMFTEVVFGLGFARRSCDHRIVKLNYLGESLVEVEIYSLAADSWRRIECSLGKPWLLCPETRVFFKGSIYWLGLSLDKRKLVLRFDVDEEIFEEMELPPTEYVAKKWELVVINGCLVLLELMKPFTVWVSVKKEPESESESGSELWSTWEDHSLPEDKNRPRMKMTIAGHIVLEGTKDDSLFAYDYDSNINGFKLNDMGFSRTSERYHMIPVKETLFMFDQQCNNGYGFGPTYRRVKGQEREVERRSKRAKRRN